MYTVRKLWIAYALATLGAVVPVALGLYTIFATGASYSNEFSTILRVSRRAYLDKDVSDVADDGRDPLPEDLAKATLTVFKQDESNETELCTLSGSR